MGGIGDDFRSKGIGPVNNINSTNGPSKTEKAEAKMGTFGYGFSTGSGAFVRNIVPEELLTKFDNVNPPKYDKNIAQLTIDDKYYIPDKPFEEEGLCCEV